MQAPAALGDTYMDAYAAGWDVVRQQRYDRQLALGVIDAGYPLSPPSDTPYNSSPSIQAIPAWDTLGADRQADLVREGGRAVALQRELGVTPSPETERLYEQLRRRELGEQPEFAARFEREAKVLASLNHPNIAAIFGIEQAERCT